MVARLTAAEAKAIGIATTTTGPGQRAGGGRSTRKALARAGVTVCHACGLRCSGETDEARHYRYDCELT